MYSSSLDFWYNKGRKEAGEVKLDGILKPYTIVDNEPTSYPNQLLYESISVFNKENIQELNWSDIDGKTLKISVYEGELGMNVIGIDETNGNAIQMHRHAHKSQ